MLISMIGASLVQTSFGKVTVKDLRWENDSGFMMSGLLFIPEGVTAENPAPAIVTSHGMYNNREMQDANFVELARRGYVVLAQDMPSHGNSDNVGDIGTITTGLYHSVKMLATLPYVDMQRIGITGHSLGAMSSNVAVTLDNMASKQLISAVLLNSADATYVDEGGAYTNVYGGRDVGIVAGQYDEFFLVDVDENGNQTSPRDFVKYGNAQSFLNFGADPAGGELRQADTVYHRDINGEDAVRVIYNPAIIHPWSHFSKRSTAATISFFEETLGAPHPLPANDQVWQYKEALNLVGLIGFAIFVVNFTVAVAHTPFFASLSAEATIAPRKTDKRGKAWFWGSLAVGAVFGTVLYVPLLTTLKSFTVFKDPWAQSSPWGVSVWALCCGLFAVLSMTVSYFAYGRKNGAAPGAAGVKMSLGKWGKTLLLAAIVVCASYGCVFFADYFFKTDFRIWTLAAKAFEADKLYVSLFPYMLFFLVYYVGNSVAINCFNYNDVGLKNSKRRWINTAVVAVAAALPAIILLVLQYAKFFSTGFLMFPDANMQVVWLFPMLVILPAAAVMSRKIYRETNNPYLPGIIMGVIVTLMSCTNTLTWS